MVSTLTTQLTQRLIVTFGVLDGMRPWMVPLTVIGGIIQLGIITFGVILLVNRNRTKQRIANLNRSD